jgi:hypothetical protein
MLAVLAVRAGWDWTPPVQVLAGNGTFRDGNDSPLGSVRKLCSYARQSVDCPPSGDGSYGGIRVF